MCLEICKIKHFLWKYVSNSLPTKSNLVNRKILQDLMCHLCSSAPENVVHALWGCEKKKTYLASRLWLVGSDSSSRFFLQGPS